MMKLHNGNDWAPFRSLTNVMVCIFFFFCIVPKRISLTRVQWLHYLSVKLLRHKGLRKPSASARPSTGKRKPTKGGSHMESEWQAYQHLTNVERCMESRLKDLLVQLAGTQREPRKSILGFKNKTTTTTTTTTGTKLMVPGRKEETGFTLESASDVVQLWSVKGW